MDTYDPFLDRYQSFNILRSVMAHKKSSGDLSKIYNLCLREAKANGNFM